MYQDPISQKNQEIIQQINSRTSVGQEYLKKIGKEQEAFNYLTPTPKWQIVCICLLAYFLGVATWPVVMWLTEVFSKFVFV